jgi:hypothetical protein
MAKKTRDFAQALGVRCWISEVALVIRKGQKEKRKEEKLQAASRQKMRRHPEMGSDYAAKGAHVSFLLQASGMNASTSRRRRSRLARSERSNFISLVFLA